MILLTSFTDALAKWNGPFLKEFFRLVEKSDVFYNNQSNVLLFRYHQMTKNSS